MRLWSFLKVLSSPLVRPRRREAHTFHQVRFQNFLFVVLYGNDNWYDSNAENFCVRESDSGLHTLLINTWVSCTCALYRIPANPFIEKPTMVIIVLYHIISFLYVPHFSADSTILMNKCNRLSLQLPRTSNEIFILCVLSCGRIWYSELASFQKHHYWVDDDDDHYCSQSDAWTILQFRLPYVTPKQLNYLTCV